MLRVALPLLLAILLTGCAGAATDRSEIPQASVGSGGGGDWSRDGSGY